MASTPRPLGSYLWDTTKDIGSAAYGEVESGMADIGNTAQAVLYGWSTQAAHNAAMRLADQESIEIDNKRIEPEVEIHKDGPVRE